MNIKLLFLLSAFVSTLSFSLSSKSEPSQHDMSHSTMSHGDQHETLTQQHDDPPLQADHMQDIPHTDHQMMNHDAHNMQGDMPQQNHNGMVHKDHGSMSHEQGVHHNAEEQSPGKTLPSLTPLKQMPMSGKAREAGFDNRYVMESTSATNDLKTLCAQASRGMIMLDNATFEKCGGKPEGWPVSAGTPATSLDNSGHMKH